MGNGSEIFLCPQPVRNPLVPQHRIALVASIGVNFTICPLLPDTLSECPLPNQFSLSSPIHAIC